MALNKAVFKTRTITAIVFAIVMLAGLFGGGIPFMLLFCIITVGCLYEFTKLIGLIPQGKKFLLLGFLYIVLPMLLLVSLGFLKFDPNTGKGTFAQDYRAYSPLIPCAIIFSIWINDTMAYVVGSFIGKTPFSKISPKKTWEGTIGGAVLCVLVISLIAYFMPAAKVLPMQHWVAVAALCAIFGTLGDLLESKLKRLANVKDSGTFMPGHGGFLDRFDSLLIATIPVFLYLYFVVVA